MAGSWLGRLVRLDRGGRGRHGRHNALLRGQLHVWV